MENKEKSKTLKEEIERDFKALVEKQLEVEEVQRGCNKPHWLFRDWHTDTGID